MSEDVIPPTDLDRLLSSFRKLVRAEFPQLTYMGIWEYAVEGVGTNAIDCSPTDTAIPLPTLSKVPLRSGLLGESVTPTIGSRALIIFVNGDPTKAVCIAVDGSPKASAFTAGGMVATEHVATVEATVLLVYNAVNALGVALAAVSPPVGITDTASMGSALSSPSLAAQWVIALNAALAQQAIPPPGTAVAPALNTSAVFVAALAAAFTGKLPNATGQFPSLGAPAVKTG